MNEDRKRMLKRVADLLRMADDVSSPNEAAIAARRAKALMDKHNIEHADTIVGEMSLEDFVEANSGNSYKRFPAWVSMLAVAVANYSGCYAKFDWTPTRKKVIKFQGEASDLELCMYLQTFLVRQIERLCKASGLNQHIGPRTSFKRGAAAEIIKMLKAMQAEEVREVQADPSKKNALVLADKKALMMKERFGVAKYSKSSSNGVSDGGAYEGGQAAGRGVSIRRGLNGATGARRIGHG